jgi:formylglycine-generating enzyme required for sulfatase activity
LQNFGDFTRHSLARPGRIKETATLRGGAWNCIPKGCRSACRYGGTPESRDSSDGFRVVVLP